MSDGLLTAAYLGAMVLFILALGGLSHPESARRGNLYGVIGMAIALTVTVLVRVTDNHAVLIAALLIGAGIG